MTTVNIEDIKLELVNFLRNQNLLERNVIEETGTINITTILNNIDLGVEGLKNVEEIEINDVVTNFNLIRENKKILIKFDNDLVNGDVLDFKAFSKVGGDKIYSDFPLEIITYKNYPRIGFELTNFSSVQRSISLSLYLSNLEFTFTVYGTSKTETDKILYDMRNKLVNNSKKFNNLIVLKPLSIEPILMLENADNKLFERSCTFSASLEFETVQ